MSPAAQPRRAYLGDGVYVSFDGYHLRLDTTRAVREDDEIDVIYLEPDAYAALTRYAAACWPKEDDR